MHTVVPVNAKLDLSAEVLPERLVLLAVVDQHSVQFVFDLLFQRAAHQLELVVLLQRLTACLLYTSHIQLYGGYAPAFCEIFKWVI